MILTTAEESLKKALQKIAEENSQKFEKRFGEKDQEISKQLTIFNKRRLRILARAHTVEEYEQRRRRVDNRIIARAKQKKKESGWYDWNKVENGKFEEYPKDY